MSKWTKEHPIEARAINLINKYNTMDKRANRTKGDLTTKWVVENIFTKPCSHCGKTGWDVIGCNRLDNSKSHTMDNVEPCCYECNVKLGAQYVKKKLAKRVDQIDSITGEVLRQWNSTQDSTTEGYNEGAVAACARSKIKKYKGYIWKYVSSI